MCHHGKVWLGQKLESLMYHHEKVWLGQKLESLMYHYEKVWLGQKLESLMYHHEKVWLGQKLESLMYHHEKVWLGQKLESLMYHHEKVWLGQKFESLIYHHEKAWLGQKLESLMYHHEKVSRIHVKIALNMAKAWNLVQMKILSCGSKIELLAFRKFLHDSSKDFSNPLDPYIILNQLFELFSAVGSVSRINKAGKHVLAVFACTVKSLCVKWAC